MGFGDAVRLPTGTHVNFDSALAAHSVPTVALKNLVTALGSSTNSRSCSGPNAVHPTLITVSGPACRVQTWSARATDRTATFHGVVGAARVRGTREKKTASANMAIIREG